MTVAGTNPSQELLDILAVCELIPADGSPSAVRGWYRADDDGTYEQGDLSSWTTPPTPNALGTMICIGPDQNVAWPTVPSALGNMNWVSGVGTSSILVAGAAYAIYEAIPPTGESLEADYQTWLQSGTTPYAVSYTVPGSHFGQWAYSGTEYLTEAEAVAAYDVYEAWLAEDQANEAEVQAFIQFLYENNSSTSLPVQYSSSGFYNGTWVYMGSQWNSYEVAMEAYNLENP